MADGSRRRRIGGLSLLEEMVGEVGRGGAEWPWVLGRLFDVVEPGKSEAVDGLMSKAFMTAFGLEIEAGLASVVGPAPMENASGGSCFSIGFDESRFREFKLKTFGVPLCLTFDWVALRQSPTPWS